MSSIPTLSHFLKIYFEATGKYKVSEINKILCLEKPVRHRKWEV